MPRRFVIVRLLVLAALVPAAAAFYLWPFITDPSLLVASPEEQVAVVGDRMMMLLSHAWILLPVDILVGVWLVQAYRRWRKSHDVATQTDPSLGAPRPGEAPEAVHHDPWRVT